MLYCWLTNLITSWNQPLETSKCSIWDSNILSLNCFQLNKLKKGFTDYHLFLVMFYSGTFLNTTELLVDRVLSSTHEKDGVCAHSETERACDLGEYLEEYSIHHIFHFATDCSAEPIYLAGKPDLLYCHTSRQAHNKFPKMEQGQKSETVFHKYVI